MRWYRDLPLQMKLQGIVLVTCSVALFLAATILAVYDRSTFLRAKILDLRTSARMVGSNSTVALTFNDATSGRAVLAALEANENVIKACTYDKDGDIFAKYSRDPREAGFSPPSPQEDGSKIVGARLLMFQHILLKGKTVGTIFLEADLKDLNSRMIRSGAIDLAVLLGSLSIAFLLSYRLQRVISAPIRELADIASSVSAHENYSIRATKRGQDEIGILFDQFNSMLDRIQQRDITIQKAHDDLEKRVAERTSFLNALTENSPLAIVVADSEQKVQLCNPAFEQLFQYTRQDLT